MIKIIFLLAALAAAPGAWAQSSVALKELALRDTRSVKVHLPGAVAGLAADRPVMAWKRIDLKAKDGTAIQINYRPLDLGASVTAEPLWVSVSNPAFDGSQKILVSILNFYEAQPNSVEQLKDTRELSLRYNGTAFMAELASLDIFEGHHSWTIEYRQELSVSVDGVWLVDPVNGTHNFRFKLGR